MLLSQILLAQNPTFNINEAALIAGQLTVDASGYNYTPPTLGLFPSITIAGTGSTLTPGTIPISSFTAATLKGSTVGTPVALSSTATPLQTDLLALLGAGGGLFSMRYSIASLSPIAWTAGSYTNALKFGISGVALGADITPKNATLTVTVPAFISVVTDPGDLEFLINDLKYLRNTDISLTKTTNYRFTVPLKINLKSNTATFTFTNGYTNVPPPTTNFNLVTAKTTTPVNTQINLSTIAQAFLPTLAVPTGNTSNVTAQYTISTANILAGFINKGTYSGTLNMELSDATSAYPAATTNKTVNMRVVVSDLSELSISTSSINMQLSTAANYKNGIFLDVSNHLTVSKTTPYSITVMATDANLKLGTTSTIPVNILSIGPAAGQSNVNTISALTTSPQQLVNGSAPTIDRNIGIRYAINASQTQALLNKPAGIYSTTITYTLTGL